MGIATKGKHKIMVRERSYLWWVADEYDEPGQSLTVVSCDKHFYVKYKLAQPRPERAFVVVVGRDFAGVPEAGGRWVRIRTPQWEHVSSITPSFVRRLIDWSMDTGKVVERVDYVGQPLQQ
jgi:hypothetical protein